MSETTTDCNGEIDYLRELMADRTVTMADVSGPCLRWLLACDKMQRVLNKTKRLGVESPISTATEFADAEYAKHNALARPLSRRSARRKP